VAYVRDDAVWAPIRYTGTSPEEVQRLFLEEAVDLGEQHRDAPAQWRELVVVVARQPDEEPLAFEPA
jgi:hypothetical protein